MKKFAGGRFLLLLLFLFCMIGCSTFTQVKTVNKADLNGINEVIIPDVSIITENILTGQRDYLSNEKRLFNLT
jgi:hypothetical protein